MKIDEDYIRSIVEKIMAEKYNPPPIIVEGVELTPERAANKRRKYFRATITIDQNLWDLAQEECKRLNILMPRFVETLMWQYFKKPTLSYQDEKESE